MKNCIFLLYFLFSILIFGCSNNQVNLITYDEENTLKINIKEKGDNIIWTREIEGNILTDNIKKNDLILNNTLSPTIMGIISNQYDAVYPVFDDFGSLDTRNLDNDVRTFINDFCSSISNNLYSMNESYFNKEYIFTYVFFVKELEQNWKKYFSIDFPVSKPEKNDIVSKLENSENEADKENVNLFTSWIFGEPFNGDDYIQIPVRFFTKKGSVDVILFITNDSQLKIFNLEIKKWEVVR